jgi:hypothetical protein
MIEFKQILPNWTLDIKEVSNNAYLFSAQSLNGNKAEITVSGEEYDYGYKKCLEGAFDIELQLKYDNKFLYALFLRLIDFSKIKEHKYHNMAFGSWYIQSNLVRVLLDGKDNILYFEQKQNKKWIRIDSLNLRNRIKTDDILKILNEVN